MNSKWILGNRYCRQCNLTNDDIISKRQSLETGVKKDSFWSEMGQDLKNRAAHSHQEIPGVPPGPKPKLNRFFLSQ